MGLLSITEAADKLGVLPRQLSDLIYQRKLDPEMFVVVGNRRLIPTDMLPVVRAAVQPRRGRRGL
jgi:hypothetical protein